MKKRAKSIATYDFSTLYTKPSHYKIKSKLLKSASIADFAVKEEDKNFIRLSNNAAAS